MAQCTAVVNADKGKGPASDVVHTRRTSELRTEIVLTIHRLNFYLRHHRFLLDELEAVDSLDADV